MQPAFPIPIAQLIVMLETAHNSADFTVSDPLNTGEAWDLLVNTQGLECAIRWTPARGFDLFISSPGDSSLDVPDETFERAREVSVRIRQLAARPRTKSGYTPMTLAELRQVVGTSQSELAATLNTDQSAVSTLERQKNLRVDTLARYIASLGGELVLRAKFSDFEVRIEPEPLARTDSKR